MNDILNRAQGCLLGQLAGDSLGSLVEFQSPGRILRSYPQGLRQLADGGTWNTIAGQPTDDSEMALLLAHSLVKLGTYSSDAARREYIFWLNSEPFDCGSTINAALSGNPKADSQANGAMMRISPLGIFGANYQLEQVAQWAMQDAAITHPNPVCLQANALFAMAIAYAVRTATQPAQLYQLIVKWAVDMNIDTALMTAIKTAASSPPQDYTQKQGWVLIAFQNSLWQLLHAPNLEEGVVDTVMQGGDTDTNAAICGALLGAVYGKDAVPAQWLESLQNCRPDVQNPKVHQHRPKCFWPVDALELAENLVRIA